MAGRLDFECTVIGGGPGGLVAAIYLRRFLRSVAVVNAGRPRASWIPVSRNITGFDQGISGAELLRRLRRQTGKLGTELIQGNAHVDVAGQDFEVAVGRDRIRTRKVILATGMMDLQPEIANIPVLREAGLLRYCPVCDAFEYRDETICVLGCDDHSARVSLFLARYSRAVTLLLPNEARLTSATEQRLKAAGVRIKRGTLLAIDERRRPKGLWIHTDEERSFSARVAYVALGVSINDHGWAHLRSLRRSEDGSLVTGRKQRLTLHGLYAVGDCVEGLAQISVAAGQAAVAATAVHHELRSEDEMSTDRA